jgi:hypothetical protein
MEHQSEDDELDRILLLARCCLPGGADVKWEEWLRRLDFDLDEPTNRLAAAAILGRVTRIIDDQVEAKRRSRVATKQGQAENERLAELLGDVNELLESEGVQAAHPTNSLQVLREYNERLAAKAALAVESASDRSTPGREFKAIGYLRVYDLLESTGLESSKMELYRRVAEVMGAFDVQGNAQSASTARQYIMEAKEWDETGRIQYSEAKLIRLPPGVNALDFYLFNEEIPPGQYDSEFLGEVFAGLERRPEERERRDAGVAMTQIPADLE